MLASVDGQLVPIPINRDTINGLYGLDLDAAGGRALPRPSAPSRATRCARARTSSWPSVGRELYEKFFRGYTRKQWGLDPSRARRASVTARIPTRTNRDDRYFTDTLPGACRPTATRAMFERMLDHPNIHVALETDYEDVRDEIDFDHLVYTGPIDEFFGHRFGPLPYRSLRFEHETLDTPASCFQPVARSTTRTTTTTRASPSSST